MEAKEGLYYIRYFIKIINLIKRWIKEGAGIRFYYKSLFDNDNKNNI
jgi:hypothetical protein